jgi:hypothetical protein
MMKEHIMERPDGAITLVELLEALPESGDPIKIYTVGKTIDHQSWRQEREIKWPVKFRKPLNDNSLFVAAQPGLNEGFSIDDCHLGHRSYNESFMFLDKKLADTYYKK